MNDVDPLLVEAPYPFQERVGFRLTGWRAGWARFELPLGPALMNRHGIPHGGVYATLLDTAMGFSGCWTGDPARREMAMTLSLTTNFLARPEGGLLVGEGRRAGGGRTSFFAEGEARDRAGTVVATATGVFRLRQGG